MTTSYRCHSSSYASAYGPVSKDAANIPLNSHPSIRVLVVEDDAGIRQALQRTLLRFGFVPVVTDCAEEAIRLIVRHPPDIAITDWDLDGHLDGVDVARCYRKVARHRPLILITGKELGTLRERTSELSVTGYLEKPFTLHQLDAVLQQATG